MNPFWSQIARELSPYVPGEQLRVANLVKLNTNESPFGPSPLALEAMRAAAADTPRLYPDPEATELRLTWPPAREMCWPRASAFAIDSLGA
jgi:histidinol-phosphate aminotransferase